MNIRIIANQESLYLCLPQGGKPDPEAECTPEILEQDIRPRVNQNKITAKLCLDYSLLVIADRIGKHHSEELTEKRKVELFWSKRRKAINNFENTLPAESVVNYSGVLISTFSINVSFAHRLIEDMKDQEKENGEIDSDKITLLLNLKEFCQQRKHAKFGDYIYEKMCDGRDRINRETLYKLDKSAKSLFNSARSIDRVNYTAYEGSIKWENIPKSRQQIYRERYCLYLMTENLGLKKSNWTPFESIETLIAELKSTGPLVVGGYFGNSCYKTKCEQRGNIGKYPIYGWEPRSRIEKTDSLGHSIIIVGAEKKARQTFVYYIDPSNRNMADGDESGQPTLRKIYAISYDSLIKNISNLNSIWFHDNAPSPFAYAWGPRKFNVIEKRAVHER